jgi:SAM-dependent methyltransferase
MKKLIKYSKPSIEIIRNKSSFFNHNETLLKRVRDVNKFYVKQKKRTQCKVCSNRIKETHLVIHDVPYCVCSRCGHLNGLHEDTIEFANYLYSDDSGKNYAKNYNKDYISRVADIYKPKVDFLIECLKQVENIDVFNVLDIGCGAGHFVKAMEDSSISAVGYDTNKSLISIGKKNLISNQVDYMDLDNVNEYIMNSTSKVLSLVGVLEHLMEPNKALDSFNDSESKYLYLQVPLFSFSALLESVHEEVFPRQLNAGHTHLFTKKSIDFLCNKHNLSIIGEWWFGTDMVDLFRHLQVMGNSKSSKELTQSLFGDLIDDLQSNFDKKKICSGVNMVIKKN